MDHEEMRRDDMTCIVRNLDALTKVDSKSISHSASIMARLFYNLEESESTTVDERLLNELRLIATTTDMSSINDFAITHLAKSFLHYVDGLITRRVTVLVPSMHRSEYAASHAAVAEQARAMPTTEVTTTSQANVIDLVMPNVAHRGSPEADPYPAPMDLKMEPGRARTPPEHSDVTWTIIAGNYLCNECARLYPTEEEMLIHTKVCVTPKEEIKKEPLPATKKQSAKHFDYTIRGLRSTEAKICPYCEQEMASCHMVEHHSRRVHMDERTAVFGCTECDRWCTTVMALIKHWGKEECPNGRFIVRKPSEAELPKNRRRDFAKIRYACNSCGKGFFSRLGVKYHVSRVCAAAEVIDVHKFLSQGIQFATTENRKGFNLAIVTSDPSTLPLCLSSFPYIQSAIELKDSPEMPEILE